MVNRFDVGHGVMTTGLSNAKILDETLTLHHMQKLTEKYKAIIGRLKIIKLE